MKFFIILLVAVLPFIILVSSCTYVKKSGCPTSLDGNPHYKWRG